ncbi:MAG TPA: hypothetical protein VKG61_10870 [Streptosporangiaceae bacterium]|nr:hypothetical protein [Streptosporangiaceae bacterium]
MHLRRLVALRDQTCQFACGCDQPAASCEPHRVDGGHTSLTNLKDYCSLEDLADVCCREAGRVAVRNERLRKFNVVWLR